MSVCNFLVSLVHKNLSVYYSINWLFIIKAKNQQTAAHAQHPHSHTHRHTHTETETNVQMYETACPGWKARQKQNWKRTQWMCCVYNSQRHSDSFCNIPRIQNAYTRSRFDKLNTENTTACTQGERMNDGSRKWVDATRWERCGMWKGPNSKN